VSPVSRVILRIIGFGALVAGGLAVALAALIAAILVGPLVFWVAWNVLNFASAVGLPELGFWGIVLATMFLVVSWFGKVAIAAIVFLVDPSWFHGVHRVGVTSGASTPTQITRAVIVAVEAMPETA